MVDRDGHVQLRGVDRDEADDHDGLYLQIVIVVIFNKHGDLLVHERSARKAVNPGDVDHVCGGVLSGETPEAAAVRETREETGVAVHNLRLAKPGINSYNRYRWLFVGSANEQPSLTEPDEINWVAWRSLESLVQARDSGELTYVNEFFEEVALAEEALRRHPGKDAL